MTTEHDQRGAGKPISLRQLLISTAALPAAAFALAMLVDPPTAQATDIDWTLAGVTFAIGGSEYGTFVTNSAGFIQSWDITTTAGGGPPGARYDSAIGSSIVHSTSTSFTIISDTGGFSLFNSYSFTLSGVQPVDPIGAALGQYTLTPEYYRLGANPDGNATAAIPEPSSLAILAAALGLFGLRRRRTRKR